MRNRRPLKFLILSITSLIALSSLILFSPPNSSFYLSPLNSHLSPLYLFFPLLSLFLFSLGTYLFRSKKHGVLIALFAIIYLLFRLNHLTHPFFLILLTGLFLTLELMVSYRK